MLQNWKDEKMTVVRLEWTYKSIRQIAEKMGLTLTDDQLREFMPQIDGIGSHLGEQGWRHIEKKLKAKFGKPEKKKTLEVFRFRYDGSYLGGTAVVIAHDLREAKKQLKELLSEHDFESLELTEREPLIAPQVVYNYDGEY